MIKAMKVQRHMLQSLLKVYKMIFKKHILKYWNDSNVAQILLSTIKNYNVNDSERNIIVKFFSYCQLL